MKAWISFLALSAFGCSDPASPASPTDSAVDSSTDTGSETSEVGSDSSVDTQPDTAVDTPPDVGTYTAFFAPMATIAGKDYTAWTVEWWKWSIAIPEAKNPVNGGDCAEGQSGDVWFLAGTSGAPATRTCKIPAGKIVLFPLVNSICFPCHEKEGCGTTKTESELTSCASLGTAKSLSASVDGVPLAGLSAHHFATKQFSFKGPASGGIFGSCTGPIATNTCGIPEGDRFGAADGYWVALEPLSKGTHTLKFKSAVTVDGSDFTQDLTYTLTIE